MTGDAARWRTAACVLAVVIVANWTQFRNYGYPRGSFYDEAIYVADAQKYLHGVFFMQDHPPLGKLLIAAGEAVFHTNPDDANAMFVPRTVAPEFPVDYSFLGYRFVPVLLAWWTAPVMFLIFWKITERRLASLALTSLWVFDNALVVHLRGALLEGPLLFFSALTILAFVCAVRAKSGFSWRGATFGAALGLAVTTKEAALILLLLIPATVWRLRTHVRGAVRFLLMTVVVFALVYVAVWQVHFRIATRINPLLPNSGYFDASPEYRAVLDRGQAGTLRTFPVALREAWTYTQSWNRGLPKLDLCSPSEIGSPAYYWPFGGRTINYRSETSDNRVFRYLYLQSNPVVWAVAFAAVLAGTLLLIRTAPFDPALAAFVTMYWAYLIGLSLMTRVLYLHSYLIALQIGIVTAGIVAARLRIRASVLTAGALTVVIAFAFFSPLTYYRPLTNDAFARRAWVPWWGLRCGSCPRQMPRRCESRESRLATHDFQPD